MPTYERVEGEARRTVLVDLDETLAEYTPNWPIEEIGMPTKGALELLKGIKARGLRVVIFSTRTDTSSLSRSREEVDSNVERIWTWLGNFGFTKYVDAIWDGDKPLALGLIDDRAIRYNGDVSGVLEQLDKAKEKWGSYE